MGRTVQSRARPPAARARRLGLCGRRAPTVTSACPMASSSMPRPTRRSRVLSSPSRRMLTRSTQAGRRSLATLASPPCRLPASIGARRPAAPITGFVGCPPFYFERPRATYVELVYGNDVGYFPDGTAYNLAGNEVNHPENIKADPHTPGAALPKAVFCNDVGYFPDGTAYNLAGNEINHPLNVK